MEELHNFTLLKEELKADFKDKDEKSMDLSQLKQQLLNSIQQKLERFKGKKCRYFLLKCKTSHSLSESKQKGIWAVPLRKIPPQPFELLNEAFENSDFVLLILSVNCSKQYQGVCLMKNLIKLPKKKFDGLANDVALSSRLSEPFSIEWIYGYDDISQGLSFNETSDLENKLFIQTNCKPRDRLINKSRNCQEIDEDSGIKLIERISSHIFQLESEKTEKFLKQIPIPFHQTLSRENQVIAKGKDEKEPILLWDSEHFELEEQNEKSVKQKIIDSLHSSLFQDFLSGKITRGIFVIGVVPHLITNFFQCKCRFLLLSPYTVLKTITKHKTITLNHFFRIQTILDTSEAIKETRPQYQRHVVFFSPWIDGEEIETSSNEPRLLEMVIKITLDGKEIYLQTIYESSIKEYQRRKTRGLLLREKVLT